MPGTETWPFEPAVVEDPLIYAESASRPARTAVPGSYVLVPGTGTRLFEAWPLSGL